MKTYTPRKINFRVFDPSAEMYLQPEINGTHCFGWLGNGGTYDLVDNYPGYIFQQFTGLYATLENCKIYEGDIVRLHIDMVNYVSEVFINYDGCAMVNSHVKGKFQELKHFTGIERKQFAKCEVIGNTLESPEMLILDKSATKTCH